MLWMLEIATVDTGKERPVTRTDQTEAEGLPLELVYKQKKRGWDV